MILRITNAKYVRSFVLNLTFSDGVRKQVDVRPVLFGPVFQALLDPDYFARMTLDPECGTVVWPNGADFAPEALHDLQEARATTRQKKKATPASRPMTPAGRTTRSLRRKKS